MKSHTRTTLMTIHENKLTLKEVSLFIHIILVLLIDVDKKTLLTTGSVIVALLVTKTRRESE